MANTKPSLWCTLAAICVVFVLTTTRAPTCNAHGRLIEPPSRASAFRYGFQTPPNYNDHELYCGGFQRQQKNGGKCGECGDPFDVPLPRPHEYGGHWGQGVVVRKYTPGSEITLRVELTASHMGYFEFRVCPELAAKQSCLDKHLLELMGGSPSMPQPGDLGTRFYPRNGSRIYEIKGQLPADLECANCVLQWRYIAGNNWGMCEDGTGAVGCGAQEEFRACADITVGDVGPQPPLRPTRPVTKAPTKHTTSRPTTESTEGDQDTSTTEETGPRYLGPLIAVLSLLAVLCVLVAIYLYSYHGQRIKHLLRWNKDHHKEPEAVVESKPDLLKAAAAKLTMPPHQPPTQQQPMGSSAAPPVPPPRTKRLSQTLPDIEANESSVLSGSTLS